MMTIPHQPRDLVRPDSPISVLGKMSKRRLQSLDRGLVKVEDGKHSTDGKTKKETRVVSDGQIHDAAPAPSPFIWRRSMWYVTHLGRPEV